MATGKKILKIILGIIFIPPLVYLFLVIMGAVIPVNLNPDTNNPDTTIYLISNGMHTDIVLPVKSEFIDWTTVVDPSLTRGYHEHSEYIGFGWGDLGFYRNTPQWEDLTLDTGFKALFLQTPAAIHARFFDRVREGSNTRTIIIDKDQHSKIIEHILNTFEYDEQGNSVPIPNLNYNSNDVFYHAKGSLHLFKTCNTWVNNTLKQAGLTGCLWTPFVEGIFVMYPSSR